MKEEFDEKFYMQTLRTADACGMQVIPMDVAARLCAIIYVFSAEEILTHCPKLRCDLKFIQEKYKVGGGEIPDAEFVKVFQKYARPLEDEYDKGGSGYEPPKWVNDLLRNKYGFHL